MASEFNTGALNPCAPDSDNDGILDAVELSDNTAPDDPNSRRVDSDGDGLSDEYETNVSQTNPNASDTDGDGLGDSEELFGLRDRFITDPLDADTDDDGLLDGSKTGFVVVSDRLVARIRLLRIQMEMDCTTVLNLD